MLLDDATLKVSILGLGHVGTALAQLLLGMREYSLHLNIVDPSADVEGAWLDLAQAGAVLGVPGVSHNDPGLLARSHVIFHVAGENSRVGASRNSVLEANIRLTRSIFSSIDLRPDARIIVVTNPVDLITWHAWHASGLPSAQVIGTGALLDCHRLQWLLHERHKVPPAEVQTQVLGEHGASMLPIWSRTLISGKPMEPLPETERVALEKRLRGMAGEIRQTAPATKWGAAACAFQLMRAFLNSPDHPLVASVLLDAESQERLGVGEIYMGMPARFDEQGAHCESPGPLAPGEWKALADSARLLSGLLGR